MPCRLRKEEIVTIQVLAQKGVPKAEVARKLGVSEGTVSYHLRRQAAGAEDGRADKAFLAQAYADAIAHWVKARGGPRDASRENNRWKHREGTPGWRRGLLKRSERWPSRRVARGAMVNSSARVWTQG